MLACAPQLSSFFRQYAGGLFAPRQVAHAPVLFPSDVKVSAIIPTYKPPRLIVPLVARLLGDPLIAQVVVVDDATPPGWEGVFASVAEAARAAENPDALTILPLDANHQRAGAVNEGLRVLHLPPSPRHDVLVLDDDVVLTDGAIGSLIRQLHADDAMGAVCTQARVANRKENILTRLQGLEYVGFNVARIADRGFLQGPLIMHGLASLIRSTVLMGEVQGYDQTQLLEDYDLTVRIKSRGYEVALAEAAVASTVVPSRLGQFWRQRVRWQYGGLTVITRHRRVLAAVFPDMLAHALTLALLLSIFSSLIWHEAGSGESGLITVMRTVSIAMSAIFYAVQLLFMIMADKGKDWKDMLLRTLLIPEFLYSFFLSLVLFGSYLFYGYTRMRDAMLHVVHAPSFKKLCMTADRVFARAGYTTRWGTK